MDRLTVISGALFVAADVFAIISLAMPDWIVTDVGGEAPPLLLLIPNPYNYIPYITFQVTQNLVLCGLA